MLKRSGQISSKAIGDLRRLVLRYHRMYGRHDLPWRLTRDSYCILVSEIMLQQTQARRVIPFYERFLERFPSVSELAQAPLSDVLRLWSGLGYNRRAKMLHEAAKHIHLTCRYSDKLEFPSTYEELRKLPGVGDYTAKAILTFAYNKPVVMIETNIRTVILHHFFPRGRAVSDARLLPILEKLLAGVKNSREWYAALMDYGAHLKAAHPNPSRRSKHHTKQSKFEGSLRQVRGAILRALHGTSFSEVSLAAHLSRYDFDHAALDQALKGLERDGMLVKRNGRWSIA